jgi:hypothetical protein
MAKFVCRGWTDLSNSLIEDENQEGYTVRSDLMKQGEKVDCRDDKDMQIQKDGEGVILIKKCFLRNCFSK